MITEIVTFTLKSAADLSDQSSEATQSIQKSLRVILEKSDGAPSIFFGQFIENPDTVTVFVNWTSDETHEAFKKSEHYQTHFGHMISVIDTDKPISVVNVPFSPNSDPSPALSAGVTEVACAYYSISTGRSFVDSALEGLRASLNSSEAVSISEGWAAEEAVPNPATEGQMSQLKVFAIGWPDVAAHEKVLKEVPPPSIEGMQHAVVRHAKMLRV